MKDNFIRSLEEVLKHEGKFSNHPNDPGGSTMKGVTLTTFRSHFGKDKTIDELRNITPEQLQTIYKLGFWDKSNCDQMPSGLDYVVFDASVNSGMFKSIKWLQLALELTGHDVDGMCGKNTLAKCQEFNVGHLINKTTDFRLGYVAGLSNWKVFGRGWQTRIENVRATAWDMMGNK